MLAFAIEIITTALTFAGLIYYLRQEDKREVYPLVSDRSGRVTVRR